MLLPAAVLYGALTLTSWSELTTPPPPPPVLTHWDALADCESGEWDRYAEPIPGSARWDHSGHRTFEGGLQFHPGTWSAFKPSGYPAHAWQATREQQIVVGERVQEAQGWGAWPVCSRKIGLR